MPTGVVNVKGFRTLIHTGGMLWGAQLGSACKSCNQSVLTSAQIEFAHPTRNPGQVRFEVVVDHGGTPSDPADDTEISFEVVKESTGRTDDFCEVTVPALS
jgi:hypothetical protein